MSPKTRATIDDLYKVDGKAELVNGELVHMSPTGGMPGRASLEIAMRLRAYEREHGSGYAFPNTVAFAVQLPHRESFGPDASWYVGSPPDMRFPEGAPIFAVAVRSENDYGRAAERAMAEKRTDYFACGTLGVWDVDLLSADVITSYKASDPERPVIFRCGEIADAEPAAGGSTDPTTGRRRGCRSRSCGWGHSS
jgi:Uma2 family endonuclease